MEGLTLGEIARVVQGWLFGGGEGTPVAGISIDSRTLRPGELFWALPGDQFDGHDFVIHALKAGAVGALISRPEICRQIESFRPTSFLQVGDSLRALQELASHQRRRFSLPVVAVTGSNGKTTTKELVAAVLARRLTVHKSQGNFNNLIGLPLTLLGLSSQHQVAVVEMGMNRAGEIAALCRIASPTLGVITNVSGAHLEFLGSIEAVQRAKGEIVQALGKEHTLIVNADDPRVVELGKGFSGRRIDFGIDAPAQVKARHIHEEGSEGIRFLLTIEGREVPVHLQLMGRHNVSNALAAAAVGHAFSLELEEIQKGLEGLGGMKMRMQLHRLRNNVFLIDDSYNANPKSMEAAIRTLAGMAPQGRSFLVIGDMLELGPQAETFHRDLGKLVVDLKIDHLITLGNLASLAAEEALHRGMSQSRVWICPNHQEGAHVLLDQLQEGDRVLVKGSRGSAMENLTLAVINNQ